jgi:hypothetical protein
MKIKRGVAILRKGLVLLSIFLCAKFITSKLWPDGSERALLDFMGSSKVGVSTPLKSIINPASAEELEFVCTLGPYQNKLVRPINGDPIDEETYQKINSELTRAGYRKDTLGILESEAHWALIFVRKKSTELEIESIFNKKVTLHSKYGGRECFLYENAAIKKTALTEHPSGFGIEFSNMN